jgi:peroxiredoxin
MPRPAIGEKFPSAKVKDIDGEAVEFPQVFTRAPATVIFFYRGRW